MKIDMIVATLRKKGYNQERAEDFALYVYEQSKILGIDPYDLINQEKYNSILTSIGDDKLNDATARGYITGKNKSKKLNDNVQRNIIK